MHGGGDRPKLGDVTARIAFAFLLGSFAAVTSSVRAEVEFAGYMRTAQGEARFVLADPAAHKTSEWIAVGGNFAGYRVTGFEAKSETLVVEKDGVARQLRLKSAALVDAASASIDAATAKSPAPMMEEEVRAIGLIEHLTRPLQLGAKRLETARESKAKGLEKQRQAEVEAGRPLSEESRAKAERMLLFTDREIADLAFMIEGNAMERDRARRTLVLIRMRDAGDDPQKMAVLQDALRELDARLAKTVAPPWAPSAVR